MIIVDEHKERELIDNKRRGALRTAALILGVLGIPSLLLQVLRTWPLDQMKFYFFIGQALMLYIFLSYGLGIGPMTPPYPPRKSETSDGEDWGSA